ncbi:MAG TPA: aminodeoxychorismate/anthranilate synthase component II [Acetivibrio sp.]|uniref:anthranilate synthase component II n=1 Tax=Acetivibrio sp. TaxID=1872092 RepID=UPI002D0533FD|nr:aminodeoxychorismate/anthranilate synthase component II [Acetivibrio sp.]HOM02695.1 aminodeoxychorismate/anthranilate synthase component II [Acetivibrio sp.]
MKDNILIIDNYDSFTYNLYQYVGEISPHIEVFRNDKITLEEIEEMNPSHIIISPGPGFPKDAGISIEAIRKFGEYIPILGVCLGHQAIGEAFGGKVVHAKELMHGKASEVEIDRECLIFRDLPEKIRVGRYHSLIVQKEGLPESLKITAITPDGEIMGLMHRSYPVFGIQFHPESILTPQGKAILRNFINIKRVAG